MTLLETGEFRDEPHPEFGWVLHLLERYRLETVHRGDGIYAVGRKTGRCASGTRMAVHMSAAYLDPRVTLDAAARECTRDSKSATFHRNLAQDEGFALGYHLFDADTGTLIVDGPASFRAI